MRISTYLKAFCFVALSLAFSSAPDAGGPVKWISFEEAVKANTETPKLVMVDTYTDWCGWCKRMDATTFKDPKVVAYLGEHFYSVKFDAEQKETLFFKGHEFKYIENGRRGYHQMAYSLLDGKMSYPSIVFLDEEMNRITISPGYQSGADFIVVLKFVVEKAYLTQSFDDFKVGLGSGE